MPSDEHPRTSPSDVLAYFITFRTYGWWLHGDARMSITRLQDESVVEVPESAKLFKQARERMIGPPMTLSDQQQEICTAAIQHLCKRRGWNLRALNVRSNHVHVVVTTPVTAERTMSDFKAFATKALRTAGEVTADASVWAYHGSTRLLFNAHAVEEACAYVVERQGSKQGVIGSLE